MILFLQKAEDAKRVYSTIKLCDRAYKSATRLNLIEYEENFVRDAIKNIYAQNKSCHPSDISFVEMNACAVKVGLCKHVKLERIEI